MDVIFTILPSPCLLITGNTAFVALTAPKKLVSNCAFISSIDESSSAPPPNPYPALLTKTSILFLSSTIVLIAFATDLSLLTSSPITCNGKFSFFATSVRGLVFSPSNLRIVAYVGKPFLAKIREVSYPIPVELPVTMATLWLSEGEEEEAIYILSIYRYTVLLKSVSDSLAT